MQTSLPLAYTNVLEAYLREFMQKFFDGVVGGKERFIYPCRNIKTSEKVLFREKISHN